MGLTVHFEVLNQLGTPMLYSATLANRPAAGITGRIFFRTDSPYGIFRDTGSAWDQIGSAGAGNTIYSGDGTLSSNRTVSSGGFTLTFTPQTTFFSSLIPAVNASSFAVLGSNTLTYAAGFNSNNIGNVYSANGAINSQIFVGDATFAQANLASAMVNVNKIDFSSGGHTVTMTQSSGIRAMTGVQNQIQFVGSHNGRITHAAVSQNLGFFRDTGSTSTLTITNAYSHLINALDDYGAGFTFTNRWGVYQDGASDKNYFAGDVGIGSNTVNATWKLGVSGNMQISGLLSFGATNIGSSNAYIDVQASEVSIYAGTGRKMSFWTNGIVRSTISSAGNFLIGTTVDSGYQLEVVGFARVTTSITSPQFTVTNRLDIYSDGANGVIAMQTLTNTLNLRKYVKVLGDDGGFGNNNASAAFQIDGTNRGFLPPRLTTSQKNAIGTPAAGLIIYDTTLNKLCVYTTAWETVTSI